MLEIVQQRAGAPGAETAAPAILSPTRCKNPSRVLVLVRISVGDGKQDLPLLLLGSFYAP